MAVSDQDVTLSDDKLNRLDRAILDYLSEFVQAPPKLIQLELQERGVSTGVRQNVNGRLVRLAEHGHLLNVHDTGTYRLVDDPRESQ